MRKKEDRALHSGGSVALHVSVAIHVAASHHAHRAGAHHPTHAITTHHLAGASVPARLIKGWRGSRNASNAY